MYSNPHPAGPASSHRGGGVLLGSWNTLYKKHQCSGPSPTGGDGTTQCYLLLPIKGKLTQNNFLILTQDTKRDIVFCHMNLPPSARQVTNLQQQTAHIDLTLRRHGSYSQYLGLNKYSIPEWFWHSKLVSRNLGTMFFSAPFPIFLPWTCDRQFPSLDNPGLNLPHSVAYSEFHCYMVQYHTEFTQNTLLQPLPLT